MLGSDVPHASRMMRGGPRWWQLACAAAITGAITVGSAHAQSCGPLPNTLTNNTTADATQVMANFNALLNCINTNGTVTAGAAGQVGYYSAAGSAISGISLSSLLDSAFGATQGAMLYRGSSGWSLLPPGPSGYVLQTGGASAAPSWVPPATGGGGIGTIVGAGVSSSAATVALPGSPPITRPALSGFTWLNQAQATATDNTNGPLVLQTFQNTGSSNGINALIKPVAGGDWTVTAEYAQGNHLTVGPSSTYYDYAGLIIYSSTTGHLYICGLSNINGGSYVGVAAYSSTTSYSSNPNDITILTNPSIIWVRAQYVSATTTLTFFYSIDGLTWQQIYSTSGPYVGVPTGYGVAVGTENNLPGYILSLNYFVDSSP